MSLARFSPGALVAALRRKWRLKHLRDPAYRFMFDAAPPDEWVALDCETTGLNVRTDEIISVGAVRIVGNRIMTSERLALLVRPDKGIAADSVRIHRLRERDVAQGLPIAEAMAQLMHFIGSRPLVGYYLEFDVAMIDRVLFPMLGMGLPQPKIEVSGLYYDLKNRQRTGYEREAQIDLIQTRGGCGADRGELAGVDAIGLQGAGEIVDAIAGVGIDTHRPTRVGFIAEEVVGEVGAHRRHHHQREYDQAEHRHRHAGAHRRRLHLRDRSRGRPAEGCGLPLSGIVRNRMPARTIGRA